MNENIGTVSYTYSTARWDVDPDGAWAGWDIANRVDLDHDTLTATNGMITRTSRVTSASRHYHMHYHAWDHQAAPSIGSVGQSIDNTDHPLTTVNDVKMIALPFVLRTCGFLIVCFVVFCVLGNLFSAFVILDPVVAVVVGLSGCSLLIMSLGKHGKQVPGSALVVL